MSKLWREKFRTKRLKNKSKSTRTYNHQIKKNWKKMNQKLINYKLLISIRYKNFNRG